MARSRRPKAVKAEPGKWLPVGTMQNYDICCDCGLTHKREFCVVIEAVTGVRHMAPVVKLFERAWRDNRATAAKRRQKAKRGEKLPGEK